MLIRLRWEPSPGDWSDGIKATVPFARRSVWFAAAFAMFSIVLLATGQPVPGVFGLVCALLIAAIPSIGTRLAFRRNPIAGRTVTADVDGHAIRMMTVDGTAYSDIVLADLAGWAETERNFVLHTGSGGCQLLPGEGAVMRVGDLERVGVGAGGAPDDADRRPGWLWAR